LDCVIISIGDELLTGRTVDTNSTWLCSRLNILEIRVIENITVPDEVNRIEEAFHRAFSIAEIVITTGGLGPTDDDKTRDAIAHYAGVKLETDVRVLEDIEAKFAARGMYPPRTSAREALIPEGANTLENTVGVAPGLYLKLDGRRHLIALPGVPSELKDIFEKQLTPILKQLPGTIKNRVETFYTTGIPESALSQKIFDALGNIGTEGLAFYPSNLGVEVRISVSADKTGYDSVTDIIEAVTKPWCFSREEKNLAAVVGESLKKRNEAVTVAESCTGGLLASRLVDIPGASSWFLGGVISYSNKAKSDVLGVNPEDIELYGAVSPIVAAQMADGAAKIFGAKYALSTTGIAGPSGGTEKKPVGLVYYALHTPEKTIVRKNRFIGGREDHRYRTSQAALNLLYLHLTGKHDNYPWADGSTESEY